MRKVILTISFLFILLGLRAQLIVTDLGMKTCLNEKYSELMKNDSTLDNALANNFYGKIDCDSLPIYDISAIAEFKSIWAIELSSLATNDLSPILGAQSITQLVLHEAQVDSLPDFSTLTVLNYVSIESSNFKNFPQLPTSIDQIHMIGNNIEEVILEDTLPQLEVLLLSQNDISVFEGLEYLPNINLLFLGNNELTEIGSFENNTQLTNLHLYANPITHTIEGLENLDSLDILHISNLGLTELPDYGNKHLSKLYIASNNLTFEDLLPLIDPMPTVDKFEGLDQQNTQGTEQTATLGIGDYWAWELDFDQDVVSNYYLWYKDSVLIDSTQEGLLEIEELSTEHEGVYSCEVKNEILQELVIDVAPFTIIISEAFEESESTAFTPNGDGDNDLFFIDTEGVIQIHTEKGKLVKELQGPVYWDGTDHNNSPLPFGFYLVSSNGDLYQGVTIVK